MKMSQDSSTARKSFSDNSLLSDPGGERERIVVPIHIESEYRGTLTPVYWLRLRIVRTV